MGIRCTSTSGAFGDVDWSAANTRPSRANTVQMRSSTATTLRALHRMTDSSHHDHVSDGAAAVFQCPLWRQQGIITRSGTSLSLLPRNEPDVSYVFRDDFGGARREACKISAALRELEDCNVLERAAREIDLIAEAEAANGLVRFRSNEEQLPLALRP